VKKETMRHNKGEDPRKHDVGGQLCRKGTLDGSKGRKGYQIDRQFVSLEEISKTKANIIDRGGIRDMSMLRGSVS